MPWQKNFDVDEALERAGLTFWEKGYTATSMRDLLEAMGIQKGSFYDTYGSKHEAYLDALRSYVDTRFDAFEAEIEGLPPLPALRRLFDVILTEALGPDGHRGCMVINGALEMAPHDEATRDVIREATSRHERLHVRLIREGQAAGDIDADLDALATGKAMLGLVMGLRVYGRSGAPKATLRSLAESALALVGA